MDQDCICSERGQTMPAARAGPFSYPRKALPGSSGSVRIDLETGRRRGSTGLGRNLEWALRPSAAGPDVARHERYGSIAADAIGRPVASIGGVVVDDSRERTAEEPIRDAGLAACSGIRKEPVEDVRSRHARARPSSAVDRERLVPDRRWKPASRRKRSASS